MPWQNQNRKLVLGVTGSFGSGKTTVARILRSYGFQLQDADKLAHACLKQPSPVYKKIVRAFGHRILKKDGAIDRKKLGETVFRSKKLLRRLNAIIHPAVIRQIRSGIKKTKAKVVVIDAPLLVEAGLRHAVDKLIVVKINKKAQVKRAKKKTGLKEIDILRRIGAQIPLSLKLRLADFIIDNSATIQETRKQVKKVVAELTLHPKIRRGKGKFAAQI